MSKKGLNIEKLLEFQNKQDEKYREITSQIEIQLEEYGEFVREMTKIKPNVKNFTNWFFDNYFHIINKKRRGDFALDKKYVLEYCNLFKKELLDNYNSKNFNLSNGKTKNLIENEYYNTIVEYLVELFKGDNIIEESVILMITDEVSYILKNEESLLTKVDLIKRGEIDTKQESIRYCFYQFYMLKKKAHIRKLLIEYLLEKFEIFSNTETSTINKHFNKKPDYYPV